MGRQLPTVNIGGILFYVDVKREELRQTDDPGNRISFNAFRQEGDGYLFLYDTSTKNTPASKKTALENIERLRWVMLPALMELDPEGIALKYDIPLDILCPEGVKPVLQNIPAVMETVSRKQ